MAWQNTKYVKVTILLLSVLLLALLTSCFKLQKVAVPEWCDSSSLVLLPPSKVPQTLSDLETASILGALDKSVLYWQKQPANRTVGFCGQQYSADQMIESLQLLSEIVEFTSPVERDRQISEKFNVCQARRDGETMVTGYYQPVIKGSLEKKPPYLYPLYAKPADLHVETTVNSNGHREVTVGRLVDGELLPYWARAEIENGNILEGQEIVYLADPVQAFFLHVQGSGVVQLTDGTSRAILFGGSNGRPYSSIGKLLADEGIIPIEEMSMSKIKSHLYEHLDEQQRILHYNERYIFFRWGESQDSLAVLGSMGEELTADRSVALDDKCFPVGIPAFLETEKPIFKSGGEVEWQPVKRFVVNQDSGSAIKGLRRIDLFCGRGQEAEQVAGLMKQPGKLYFFVKK